MKYIKIIVSVFLTVSIYAQDCQKMLPFKQGASTTYKNYDDKQKLTGSHKQNYIKVLSEGEKVTSTVKLETFDKKGKPQGEPMEYTIKCQKGLILMDMSKMLPAGTTDAYKNMQMKMKGEDLEYPSTLTVGQTLKGGKMDMEISTDGTPFANMHFEILNRKVDAKETITTPAGTFECYKISEEFKSESVMTIGGMNMPGIKINGKSIQWYNIESGMIKTESYSAKGNLQGTSILEEIK